MKTYIVAIQDNIIGYQFQIGRLLALLAAEIAVGYTAGFVETAADFGDIKIAGFGEIVVLEFAAEEDIETADSAAYLDALTIAEFN